MADLIVTVDGPGGTGKSTVSRAVAERLDLPHLDTGAFYRAATLAVLRDGVDPDDPGAIASALHARSLTQEAGRMYLDGEDVTEEIRGAAVTAHVSQVSAHPAIRDLLVGYQRRWVADHGQRAVVEGRDIGSVVFPDATVKVYLDAHPEVRAERRAAEAGDDLTGVLEDLERRDRLDSTRTASPLAIPEDAVVIDTSYMTFDEVVERVVSLIESVSG